jgi:signal transduction histidine kinase
MQGLAHLLQTRAAPRLNDDDRRVLEMQLRAAGAMKDTVEALLLLARSTLQPMTMEPLDLSALAQEVADALPSASDRVAPVAWEVQPDMQVRGSAAALRIVLVNLMGNAAKFTRGVAAPRVTVSAQPQAAGWLQVAVQDNGAGFAPEQAERLFKPFSRLHDSARFAGTGIGLTIVQRIVERHGGTVSAQGRPEEGARFEFTLPAAAAPTGQPANTAGTASTAEAEDSAVAA